MLKYCTFYYVIVVYKDSCKNWCKILQIFNFCSCYSFEGSLSADGGFCMLCELHKHIARCYDQTGGSVKPWGIINKLRCMSLCLIADNDVFGLL